MAAKEEQQLTRDKFFKALKLIALCQNGKSLDNYSKDCGIGNILSKIRITFAYIL